MKSPRPVTRLEQVADATTEATVDPGLERIECLLDERGFAMVWRLWVLGSCGRWHPASVWLPPYEIACVYPDGRISITEVDNSDLLGRDT